MYEREHVSFITKDESNAILSYLCTEWTVVETQFQARGSDCVSSTFKTTKMLFLEGCLVELGRQWLSLVLSTNWRQMLFPFNCLSHLYITYSTGQSWGDVTNAWICFSDNEPTSLPDSYCSSRHSHQMSNPAAHVLVNMAMRIIPHPHMAPDLKAAKNIPNFGTGLVPGVHSPCSPQFFWAEHPKTKADFPQFTP